MKNHYDDYMCPDCGAPSEGCSCEDDKRNIRSKKVSVEYNATVANLKKMKLPDNIEVTQEGLDEIQKECRMLKIHVSLANEMWDRPKYVMLSVILQNMGHSGKNCTHYAIEDDITILQRGINFIGQLSNDYPDDYVIQHVHEELCFILLGAAADPSFDDLINNDGYTDFFNDQIDEDHDGI